MPEQMPGDVSMQPGGPAMPPPQPQPRIQQPPPQRDTMPAADMPDQDGQDGLEQERQPWPDLPRGEEPYIRRNGQRHHSEWGQPDFIMRGAQNYPGVAPGPWMPQISDVNRLVWEATQGLMQNGSVPVAKLAGLMGNARGNYTKEYLAGRKAMMELQHEQYAMAQDQLVRQQNQELREYAEIFANHADNPSEMTEELTNLANKFNDHRLLTELNSKGLAAAEKLLAVRDNLSAEMGAVRQQRDKHSEAMARVALDNEKVRAAKRSEEEAAAFGVHTGDGEAGTDQGDQDPSDQDASESASGGAPAAKAAPATPGPADAESPSTAPDGGVSAPTGVPQDRFPATPQGDNPPTAGRARPLGLPAKGRSDLDTASDDLLRAGPDQTNMIPNKQIRFGIMKDALRKKRQIDDVLTNPDLKNEDDVKRELTKISPAYAADLDNFLHYRGGPSTAGLGGGSRQTEYWSTLRDLARKVNPNWSQSTFKAVQDFEDDARKPTSVQQRVQTTSQAGEQILKDLDAIQKKYGLKADTSLANLKGKFALDPKGLYGALYSDWLNYQQDIQVLTTGSPSVTEVKMAENQVPWYGNAASYRNVVKHHMGVADARIQGLKSLWNSYQTDRPMPGLNPVAEKRLDDIKRMEPVHGLFPGETLKTDAGTATYTGIDPEDPDADVNWDWGTGKRRPP